MKKIEMKECFLCHCNGSGDPLDAHHIYGGAYRKKSEKYGLVIPLCHYRCHTTGRFAAHNNSGTMLYLKHRGQQKVMEEQGWDTKRFIQEFGKDYTAIFQNMIGGNGYAESYHDYGAPDKGP